ncbi:type II toxin-antitoxin system RelE/ParE family toxin [Parapedobacter sp. ISTM3]|uniref:type II toxin-antitoxin system RelE/ParE family toxin n=1 Tax=Parapedobacter sp. ISTM3 TaxID=2800130 RepID=UPI001F2994C7|nr:type II toxin-antitoxin system RelE/ParE family toxin [Parapedobacter sp. ISTM3]
MEFYAERSQSTAYSTKLYKLFTKNTRLLLKHPQLGIKTSIEGVRGLIVSDYILFYEFIDDAVVIHTLWPCKQNPEDLVIK